jgi:hypothetical protein
MKTSTILLWLEVQGRRSERFPVALAQDLLDARKALRKIRLFGEQVREQGDAMLVASDFAGALLELIPPDDLT